MSAVAAVADIDQLLRSPAFAQMRLTGLIGRTIRSKRVRPCRDLHREGRRFESVTAHQKSVSALNEIATRWITSATFFLLEYVPMSQKRRAFLPPWRRVKAGKNRNYS